MLRSAHGIEPVRAQATVEVVVLDPEAARRLQARPASAGLLLTRRTFDAGGRCFEYARDVYRADRAVFSLEAEIPPQPM